MRTLPLKRIENLCEVTSSKRIYASELVSSGVPFLKSKEIIEIVGGQTSHSNPLFISEDRFQKIVAQTGALEEGDILLTSRGTLGVPYIVKATDRFHFADGNLTWFRRFKQLDSGYLAYFFLSPLGKAELAKCVIGSSQQAYTIAALRKVEIALPSLLEQQQIANTLSAYDDLIDNSRRRIRILESMARALYREWFVKMNAPQHLKTQIRRGQLGELCDLARERYSEKMHADRPLLDLSRMPQRSLGPEDLGAASELTTSRILFEPGDTLFGAIRCYLHKVSAVHFSGVTNTSVLVLRPKISAFRSLVAIIASDADTISWADTHSTGTKMPVVNGDILKTMPASLPSESVAEAFEVATGPMLDMIGVLSNRIQNLRRTRNLLLPRLLSGQVPIRELAA